MRDYLHTRFGDYRILQEIGAGGMGQVFLAENIHHHKQYALKILPEDLGVDVNFRKRFFDEARVMSELDHARIVRVHHVGEYKGTYYLVMDYVTGPEGRPWSLHDELRRQPGERVKPEDAIRWTTQIAEGIAYAHRKGVIHRDIKPANILMTADRNVKITDFGLAKAIGSEFILHQIHQTMAPVPGGRRPGDASGSAARAEDSLDLAETLDGSPARRKSGSTSILGTYDYMSPELRDGKDASVQSDIYSLGVLAYRISTGRRPVGMTRPPSAVVRGYSKKWDTITAKCLADNVADRYGRAEELLRDLTRLGRRSRIWVAAFLTLLVAASALVVTWRTLPWPVPLNHSAWESWRTAISWIRPLQQVDVEQRPDWRADSDLVSLLEQVKICCLPFSKSPELERRYRENENASPEQLQAALGRCEKAVAGNRDAVSALHRASGMVVRVEEFFSKPSAAGYWPRLSQLRQDGEALRAAGCSALCSFLDPLLRRFEPADRVNLTEAIQQVLDLTAKWSAVEYDRLDPAALAASPGLQEPVQDIPDLVGRLAKLKDCYRPSPDQSQKLETAARTFLVARQSIEEIVKVARAQQVEGASELEAVWQNLGADVARADALPRVAANGDRMVETYDRARRTLLAQGYLKSLEWALRYCYRPEEEPPWFAGGKTTAARNLSDTWRRGEPAVGVEVNAEIATRLQTLHAVQAIQEKSVLVDKAKSPEVQVEAVWYAWWRLDRLPAYRWPQTLQDWEEEQFLQKKLRQGLTARALGPSRLESLLGTVTDANGTRETTFRKAMVDNRIQAISAHSHSDLFLNTLAAQGSSRIRTAREARTWETTTTNLATFVAEPGWTDKYDLVRFYGKEGKGTGIMDRVLARGVVATQDVDDWRQALTTYLKKAELPAAVAPVRPPAPAPSGPKPVAPSLALTGVGSADLVVQIPGGKGGSPVRLEMKRIPAQGLWFRMGIPAGSIKQTGDPLEQTKQLTKDFYIGKFEVTQAQYWAVMGADLNSRASAAPIDPNRPIENVSWQDAARFCERLNQMEKGNRFRLPTEMEWEYACRGQRGGKTWKELPDYFEYFTGDGEAALRRAGRYRASSLGGTERAGPVGQWHEGRHIWELYDMHGNVWEWCSDEYPDSSSQGGTSPKRAIRGGAYDSRAEECRSAWRDGRRQEEASPNIGFRLVREVE